MDSGAGLNRESEVTIRALPPDQWEAYRGLRLEALWCEPQAFGTSYADARQTPEAGWRLRLEAAASAHDSWMLFAEHGGTPVGMVAAFVKEPGVAEIVSVYVTASERGRGIARRLMEAILVQIASDARGTTVSLTVNKAQSAALALYRSLGFEITGVVTGAMGDGMVYDEYTMEKGAISRAG